MYRNLSDKINRLNEVGTLRFLSSAFPGEVVFSSSFSWEDQAITHMILSNKIPVEIFTLDTGRMFSETYYVWNRTNEIYGTRIKPYYPQNAPLENYVAKNGPNAFYESAELRKECCFIRKVEPLNRALKGKKIWITGLRAEHSVERENLAQLEWDQSHQLYKYHPLLHWSTEQVK
ncbi:MAG TPA: phosphoadenylyl-sulfate reductase, partial [Arachidicoccus sp.]